MDLTLVILKPTTKPPTLLFWLYSMYIIYISGHLSLIHVHYPYTSQVMR